MSGKHCGTCRCPPQCKFCGAKWNEDDEYYVEVRICQTENCQTKVCLDCKIYCDQCSKDYCQDCQIMCQSCQTDACPNCIDECITCLELYCDQCGDTCKNCSKPICNECIEDGNHQCQVPS